MTVGATIARYQIGLSFPVFGGLSALSLLIGATMIWPTDFMLQRPIFSALVPVVFLLSLLFVWKLFEFLWAVIARRGAAIYFDDGRLVTIAGSVPVDQIVHVEAKVGQRDNRYVEIALKSGKRRWFGVGLLDTDADTIATQIRAGAGVMLTQTAQS